MVVPQHNMMKLKLEYWYLKFGFNYLSAKKEKISNRKIFVSLELDFFLVQLKFGFRIWLVIGFGCTC